VATARGRVAYGPVTPADVPGLFNSGFVDGAAHALRLGDPAELPWLRGQQRLTCARLGVIDPASLEDYRRHGGLAGLERALTLEAAELVRQVTDSGLRGRGGACSINRGR
jgi:formate dehydrogenase iron-sulfur subunit